VWQAFPSREYVNVGNVDALNPASRQAVPKTWSCGELP